MLAVTFLGSGGSFFFGWAKPVPVDPRFFKDGQRGMMLGRRGRTGSPTSPLALFAAGLHLAHVHLEPLRRRRLLDCCSCST